MIELVVAIFMAFVPPAAGDALTRTAPAYLTPDVAREHVAAAVLAAAATGTDAADLLSIAWHESRYKRDAFTPEPGARFSCGVMTPEPLRDRAACDDARSSLVRGYLAGARHLRAWYVACRGNRACALRGYGGKAAPVFAWRASLIARELRAGRRP